MLLARKLTREIPGQVATVGRLSFAPGLTNVVPGRAVFTLGHSQPRPGTGCGAPRDGFFSGLEAAADREGVGIERRELARFGPAVFDERVIALVEEARRRSAAPAAGCPPEPGTTPR